jgi:hypothetical protein
MANLALIHNLNWKIIIIIIIILQWKTAFYTKFLKPIFFLFCQQISKNSKKKKKKSPNEHLPRALTLGVKRERGGVRS